MKDFLLDQYKLTVAGQVTVIIELQAAIRQLNETIDELTAKVEELQNTEPVVSQ